MTTVAHHRLDWSWPYQQQKSDIIRDYNRVCIIILQPVQCITERLKPSIEKAPSVERHLFATNKQGCFTEKCAYLTHKCKNNKPVSIASNHGGSSVWAIMLFSLYQLRFTSQCFNLIINSNGSSIVLFHDEVTS